MRLRLALVLFVSFLGLHTTLGQISPIRGAALGGWLLLEKFITPSLMGNNSLIVDEWTFGLYANETQRLALQEHWASFYGASDFTRMQQAGLTHVRIAVGYWHMYSQDELDAYLEPYLTGGWDIGLVPTLAQMKPYGLRAIIDLHGLPGWGVGDTVNRTFDVLERLAQRILELEKNPSTAGVVIGIEPVNEAACWNVDGPIPGGITFLQQFYVDAYRLLRSYLPAPSYMFVVEQTFLYDQWIGFMSEPEYQNVWMDVHVYQAFTPSLYNASFATHYAVSCDYQKQQIAKLTLRTLVGEWSLAYKQGSWNAELEPYPSTSQTSFIRRWFLADIYENTNKAQGWFYWTWKTESAPFWDYSMGLSGGWIPPTINDTVIATGGCNPLFTAPLTSAPPPPSTTTPLTFNPTPTESSTTSRGPTTGFFTVSMCSKFAPFASLVTTAALVLISTTPT